MQEEGVAGADQVKDEPSVESVELGGMYSWRGKIQRSRESNIKDCVTLSVFIARRTTAKIIAKIFKGVLANTRKNHSTISTASCVLHNTHDYDPTTGATAS